MSVKHSILAILSREPAIAYHVKKEFELLTVGIWPINDGQIYTTLHRLQRDGLIEPTTTPSSTAGSSTATIAGRPPADAAPAYRVTADGRRELQHWLNTARTAAIPERDELAIKVALALAGYGDLDIAATRALLDAQRAESTAALQRLTRTKAQLSTATEHYDGQCAVLDAAAARSEAELRWLDVVEARLSRTNRKRSTPRPTPTRSTPTRPTPTNRKG